MLNAHFTQFAQRFAYLQVNCCECSRCSGKSREPETQRRSDGQKVGGEERNCFACVTVSLNLDYRKRSNSSRSIHGLKSRVCRQAAAKHVAHKCKMMLSWSCRAPGVEAASSLSRSEVALV